MTITITKTTFGFHIAFVSDDRQSFARTIESFKLAIPKANRRYHEDTRIWFVDKRAEPKLRAWLYREVQTGETKVMEFDRSRNSMPDEAA
jgi:hypothetical protein